MLHLAALHQELKRQAKIEVQGRAVAVRGSVLLARLPHAAIGQVCYIAASARPIPAQIIAFQDDLITLAPLDHLTGIGPGAAISGSGELLSLNLPLEMPGRILDALGAPIDREAPEAGCVCDQAAFFSLPADRPPPNPLSRCPINTPLATGVRAIDAFCPIGRGQRIGLFASAGIGKSTLLGMIARHSQADLNVIALVAERGREVGDFIQEVLGPEGLRKSVLVVATSDESPARRQLAALSATAIAEHFRAQGKHVLLLVDSLTRTARAIREVGLAAGELPVRQGYTSSVYTALPRLIERAGTDAHGSISAIYTVLTAGENDLDPLGEELKSLLDGHIILDSGVAARGIRPAVDLTQSVSRLVPRLLGSEKLAEIRELLGVLQRLKKDKDILLLGGTPDPELRAALELEAALSGFLNQAPNEKAEWQSTRRDLAALAEKWRRLKREAPKDGLGEN